MIRERILGRVFGRGVPAAALLVLSAVTGARDADACGGCFHPAADLGGSFVTDHRMVFEITAKETILWDQVRYTGNPAEFAWVLPVHAGAKIELSRGEWISALDTATRATVTGPQVICPATTSTSSSGGRTSSSGTSSPSSGGGGGGGCGGGGYSASTESAAVGGGSSSGDGPSGSGNSSPTFAGNEEVDVVAQSSIGPYQAVTIRATGTAGISDWLKTNGFAIPSSVVPVIDSYTLAKFDFIALRLKPGQGVQAMRPVRVVSPGADTTLPLRMVAAGVGAKVGLTLWVIGEGRYRTQNFPNAPVDWASLAWNVGQSRSNRTELEAAALASNGGRSWITESAVRTSVTASGRASARPNVFDAYLAQCKSNPSRVVPCDETALPPPDGEPGEVPDPDGGAGDAGAGDAAACTKVVRGCDGFDDLDVAARSIHAGDVWVTRLRADLPVSALSTDLQLEAALDQNEASPAHSTTIFNPPYEPCPAAKSPPPAPATPARSSDGADGCTCRTVPLKSDVGTWLLIGLTMVALPMVVRRRKR